MKRRLADGKEVEINRIFRLLAGNLISVGAEMFRENKNFCRKGLFHQQQLHSFGQLSHCYGRFLRPISAERAKLPFFWLLLNLSAFCGN